MLDSRQGDVSFNRMFEDQALDVPVLRHQRDAQPYCCRRIDVLQRDTVQPGLTRLDGPQAEDGLQDLGASAADKPGKAVDFAGAQFETGPVEPVIADAFQFEHGLFRGNG